MGVLTVGLTREATTVATPAVDRITVGRHERFVVDRDTSMARVRTKAAGASA